MNTGTIVISGANGFIGSALTEHFHDKGMRIVGLTRSNCDYMPATIADIIQRERPGFFIHAAGNSSVSQSYDDPRTAEEGATVLTQRVLEGVKKAQFPVRYISLSTAAVYGIPQALPIAETAPLNPISPYGHQKLACEQLVDEFAHAFEKSPVIIRIFSLFGAAQKKLVLYELFRKFMDDDKVRIRGTGQETRDFLSIAVFCQKLDALLDALPDSRNTLKINVAAGESHGILESARLMARLLGSNKDIVCEGAVLEGNPPHWEADITLYNQLVKTRILFDFGQELSKTLAQWKAEKTA